MGFILDILGSAGFGSLLGGVMGYLTKREERVSIKMKLDHDIEMIDAKTNASIEIAKMGIETAQVAGQLLVDKIDAKAFEVSQKSSGVVGDVIKSSVRPIILAILMWQSYSIINNLETLTGGIESLPAEDIIGLYRVVVLSITGLTATAVGWYYAARTSKQFDKLIKMDGGLNG